MESRAVQVEASDVVRDRVRRLPNDELIIDLINTLNHLSRWLTPIHDQTLLEYAPRRSEPSVKQLLEAMRDTEARAYSLMYAIATLTNPDLDQIPRGDGDRGHAAAVQDENALVVMSGFRRLRESSTSLLRALPDSAWDRGGYSRTKRNWTIRELAEFLAVNDWAMLAEIDRVLAGNGARMGIARVSQVRFEAIEEPYLAQTVRE